LPQRAAVWLAHLSGRAEAGAPGRRSGTIHQPQEEWWTRGRGTTRSGSGPVSPITDRAASVGVHQSSGGHVSSDRRSTHWNPLAHQRHSWAAHGQRSLPMAVVSGHRGRPELSAITGDPTILDNPPQPLTSMVRKGSSVRVRQRALVKTRPWRVSAPVNRYAGSSR
jgi:hypothetical protein